MPGGKHQRGEAAHRWGSGPMVGDADHQMDQEHRRHMLQEHHRNVLWVYWLVIMLGFWMIAAPWTFAYGVHVAEPSGGRSVWLSLDHRIIAMKWSDALSGLLLIVLGWYALKPNRPVVVWACCLVGVWLTAAPLIFWSPSAAGYLNDTIVGALVIALTILIPGMPNMIMYMKMGPPIPPGWTYNPSSWPQRWIMIATGFAGWLVSRYLAAFQLGYISSVWDPFFGQSSIKVLNSDMSHAWPVSDAGLGAFSYTFEFLMGFMGSPTRWRTMPWMVTFFGLLVIPLGLTHILLVISQPVLVGHWCAFCLLAAAIMLPMIPLEVDEVIAMGQHLAQSKRRGDSLWQAFWKGGSATEGERDERMPELADMPSQPWKVFKSSLWGMSAPWTLVASAAFGIWLMFAPAALSTATPAASVDHLAGALVLTVSVVCMAEVIRLGRYVNVLLGAAVLVLSWLLGGATMAARLNDTAVGVLIIALAIPRGPKHERYGSWDRFVR